VVVLKALRLGLTALTVFAFFAPILPHAPYGISPFDSLFFAVPLAGVWWLIRRKDQRRLPKRPDVTTKLGHASDRSGVSASASDRAELP
jgi:asparagine N-glycosylation enzyme membrane subunit Stt3